MKTLFRTACLLIGVLAISNFSYSQINVTRTDFEKILKSGLGVSIKVENIDSVNIGKSGGPNIYDFSFVSFDTVLADTPVNSWSIPEFIPRFPSASFALITGGKASNQTEYALFSVDDNACTQPGNTRLFDSLYTNGYEHSNPPQIFINFPVTYNTNYSQTATHFDTAYHVPGTEINIITVRTKVDGYGTLKLPGNVNLECLRVVKAEDTPYHYKSYGFFTKEGILLMVETNNEQVDTGKVRVSGNIIGLYGDGAATFVNSVKGDPQKIKISPNPSSDKVFIEYSLLKNSWVKIEISDIHGRKIKELKNGFCTANKYQFTEDISKLSKGIYFISVTTEDGVHAEKLFVQ